MAKAKFSRAEGGGYDATYNLGDHRFSASFVKSADGKEWSIADGLGASTRTWDKLRDLKAEWAGWCEAEASSPAPETPKLAGPPKLGPPKLGTPLTITPPVHKGPPALSGPPKLSKPAQASQRPQTPGPKVERQEGDPAIPGKPIAACPAPQTRGVPSSTTEARGNAHQHADPERYAAYLHARGKLLGPVEGCDEFRCDSCGAHMSSWERKGNEFLPPCRCNRPVPNPVGYLPCWDDPTMWFHDPEAVFMRPTSIGALDMVYNWMRANPDLCSFKGMLIDPFKTVLLTLHAETGRPEYDPALWKGIR